MFEDASVSMRVSVCKDQKWNASPKRSVNKPQTRIFAFFIAAYQSFFPDLALHPWPAKKKKMLIQSGELRYLFCPKCEEKRVPAQDVTRSATR